MKVRWILEQVLVHGWLFTYCLLSPYESNPSYQHGYVWIIRAVQCNKWIVYTYVHGWSWSILGSFTYVNIDRKVPPLLATTWLCVLGAYGNFPGWFSLQRLLLKTGCKKTLPLPKDRCDKAFHQKCHEPPAWIPAVCEWFVCENLLTLLSFTDFEFHSIDLLLFLIETSKKRSPECDGSKGRLLWEPRRPMATTSIWRREELDCVQPGQRVSYAFLCSFWVFEISQVFTFCLQTKPSVHGWRFHVHPLFKKAVSQQGEACLCPPLMFAPMSLTNKTDSWGFVRNVPWNWRRCGSWIWRSVGVALHDELLQSWTPKLVSTIQTQSLNAMCPLRSCANVSNSDQVDQLCSAAFWK